VPRWWESPRPGRRRLRTRIAAEQVRAFEGAKLWGKAARVKKTNFTTKERRNEVSQRNRFFCLCVPSSLRHFVVSFGLDLSRRFVRCSPIGAGAHLALALRVASVELQGKAHRNCAYCQPWAFAAQFAALANNGTSQVTIAAQNPTFAARASQGARMERSASVRFERILHRSL